MSILIVEDDAAINRLLSEALVTAGYNSSSAYSGSEALLMLTRAEYQLVILDLMLPGKTGAEVLSEIRRKSAVPVIVLSARVDKESKLALLGLGADDYVTKPFDVDELLARVEAQLRRSTVYSERRHQLSYLDITLLPDTYEAMVGDEAISLTLREFQILSLLIANPKQVFTRSQIYESVWGNSYLDGGSRTSSDDKTVNVHISNLRAKLGKSQHNHIKTVWGIGFRLAE
ncbi:MAG: response regulator transcription factor [Clostridiales bacterium]|jgi:DNA-binding response OmpR family regulator|nr:response regulator transcription factor [Clostridiales bacterium]